MAFGSDITNIADAVSKGTQNAAAEAAKAQQQKPVTQPKKNRSFDEIFGRTTPPPQESPTAPTEPVQAPQGQGRSFDEIFGRNGAKAPIKVPEEPQVLRDNSTMQALGLAGDDGGGSAEKMKTPLQVMAVKARGKDVEAYNRAVPLKQAKPPVNPGVSSHMARSTHRVGHLDPNQFDSDPIVDVGVDKHTKMSYWPAKGLQKAVNEAKAAGIPINDFTPLQSTRSYGEQAGLRAKLGNVAGTPGNTKETGSLHQFGFAIDIGIPYGSSGDIETDYAAMDEIMGKYGFARPFKGDPKEEHHYSFQPALAANDPERVWEDKDPRMVAWRENLKVPELGSVDDIIVNSAALRGYGPKATSVVDRLFLQESGKRTRDGNGNLITSPVGAIGIGQMMPGTLAPYLKERGLTLEQYKANDNIQIDIAVEHFDDLLKSYNGNLAKTLAAYNGGPGTVEYAETRGKFPASDRPEAWSNETLNYVSNILQVSPDQAMKWIAQGGDDPDDGPMADYGTVTQVKDARKEVAKWVDFIGAMDEGTPEGVRSEGLGDFVSSALMDAKAMYNADAERNKKNTEEQSAHAQRGMKEFLKGMTSNALMGLTGMIEGIDTVDTGFSGTDLIPDYLNPAGSIKKAQKFWNVLGVDGKRTASPVRKLAEFFEPDLATRAEADAEINRLRGADTFVDWLKALDFTEPTLGIGKNDLIGNAMALEMEVPHLLGTIMGALFLGPEAGALSKLEKMAPDKLAKLAGPRVGPEELIANWLRRGATGATESKAFQSLGLSPAARKIGDSLSPQLEGILTYSAIGAAQAGVEGYSDVIGAGGSFQEGVAAGLQNAFIGALLGLAMPLAVPTLKMGGNVMGGIGAKGLAKARGETLAGAAWKDYTAASVLDYVARMDNATGGKFSKNIITKKLPKWLELGKQSERRTHVKDMSSRLKTQAEGYLKSADTFDKQVENQFAYVKALEESLAKAKAGREHLENSNPNVAMFGEGVADRLDKLQTMEAEVQQLGAMTPEQRQAWTAENEALLKEAGAKDIDELLVLKPNKKGEPISKAQEHFYEQRVAAINNVGKSLSPAEISKYRKFRNSERQAEQRLELVKNSPIMRDKDEILKVGKTLRHTATVLQKRAEWLEQNIDNPFEHLHPNDVTQLEEGFVRNPLMHPKALQANLDVFDHQFKQLVKEGANFTAVDDVIAFEATRNTRALLQAQAVDPEVTLTKINNSLDEGLVNVGTDIHQIKQSITNSRNTIKRIEETSSPEKVQARVDREYSRFQERELKAQDRIGDLEAERALLDAEVRAIRATDLSTADTTPEHITGLKSIIKDARKKVKVVEKLQKSVAEHEALSKDLSKNITKDTVKKYEEYKRFNYGEMVALDANISKATKKDARVQTKLKSQKEVLGDLAGEAERARALLAETEQRLGKVTRAQEIEKRFAAIETLKQRHQTEVNKATSDMQALKAIMAKREAKLQPRRAKEISRHEESIALDQENLALLEEIQQSYNLGREGLKDADQRIVVAQPTTRPNDPLLQELGQPKVDPLQKAANDAFPLAQVKEIYGSLAPEYQQGLYAQELLAASDAFMDLAQPGRAAMKLLQGAPDPWNLVDVKAFVGKAPEHSLPQELAQAFHKVRTSELDAAEATNPLNWVSPENVKEIVGGIKKFHDSNMVDSVVGAFNRGRNSFKTYVNQMNHAREVSGRVRDSWGEMVKHLPESVVEGRGSRKTLKPEVATKMMDAVESIIEGPEGMKSFLKEFPQLKKPMEMFIGVVRTLENYKTLSPELRNQFRDGYLMHVYPRQAEFRGRGLDTNIKSIRTGLGSEQKRSIDTLSMARAEYDLGLKTLDEFPGWDKKMGDPAGLTAREGRFLKVGGSDRARIMDMPYGTAAERTKADAKAKAIINRLALKNPITDPGELMGLMVRSTMEAAAVRNNLKNVAHVNLPDMKTAPDGVTRVPMKALEYNGAGVEVTLKDGSKGVMTRLDQIKGLHIDAEDTITFGGQEFKAKELAMHPELANDFGWAFANKTNQTEAQRATQAMAETLRSFTLMGSPLPHAYNILSGHWTTLSTNAISSMWNSAWKGTKGAFTAKPEIVKEGAKEFLGGVKDLLRSPLDTIGLGVVGNKMLKGEIDGVSPQMLMSDALLHGLNMNTWSVTRNEAQQSVIGLIAREDPELGAELQKGFFERATSKEGSPKEAWDSLVGQEGLYGQLKGLSKTENHELKRVGKATGIVIEGTSKGLMNADYFGNQFMTYEPMKQAGLAAYNIQAALHWEAQGQKLVDSGVPVPQALKMIKEEAARYVNNRLGTLQHWNKVNMSLGMGSGIGKNMDMEAAMYGTQESKSVSLPSVLLNATTPGWLRSKIELLSNGVTGRRLNDIPNTEFRDYMKREWRKQLAVGLGTTMVAQQLLKFAFSGGSSGLFSAVFNPEEAMGSPEYVEAIRAELEDPRQFTDIQVGSNTSFRSPFYGQMRDAEKLATGTFLRPENLVGMIENNVNKPGIGALEAIWGRDFRTGKSIRMDESSLDLDAKASWGKKTGTHILKKLSSTFNEEVLMQDRRGGFKPMTHVAASVLGISVKENSREQNLSDEQKTAKYEFEGATRDEVEKLVQRYSITGDQKYYEEAMRTAAVGLPVSGKAKRWTMMFPNKKAPINIEYVGDMLMKYQNKEFYLMNNQDPKFQMQYIQRLKTFRELQSELYGEIIYDEATQGEKTLKVDYEGME